jgi:uncharacterized protein (DUF4415 family)
MEFEWEDDKAAINFRKHKVRFSEAVTVWFDHLAREIRSMRDKYDFSKAKPSKEVKIVKTFRLDPDILEWLDVEGEKQGMGYQTFLNWFLRKSMDSTHSIEDRLEKLEQVIYKKKA